MYYTVLMSFLFELTEFQLNQNAFKTNILLKFLSQDSSLQSRPVPVHPNRSDLNGASSSEGALACVIAGTPRSVCGVCDLGCARAKSHLRLGVFILRVTEIIMMLTIIYPYGEGVTSLPGPALPPCAGAGLCVSLTPLRCPIPGPLNL